LETLDDLIAALIIARTKPLVVPRPGRLILLDFLGQSDYQGLFVSVL
jgi:hypothetical protein